MKITGIGSFNPSPVTSVPVLVEDAPFPVIRAARPSFPLQTASGAFCFPVQGACFTSHQTREEARRMCDSGQRPQRDNASGCPIGSPRIDPYGSSGETSASQFDPCYIRDLPVCGGDERFGDLRRWENPEVLHYQGIFGTEEEPNDGKGLNFLGGTVLGFLLGGFAGVLLGAYMFAGKDTDTRICRDRDWRDAL